MCLVKALESSKVLWYLALTVLMIWGAGGGTPRPTEEARYSPYIAQG